MHRSLNQMVVAHLLKNRRITSQVAFEKYGITRLSSCIYELRSQGYPIITTTEEGVNRWGDTVRYGVYRLPKGWHKGDLAKKEN